MFQNRLSFSIGLMKYNYHITMLRCIFFLQDEFAGTAYIGEAFLRFFRGKFEMRR